MWKLEFESKLNTKIAFKEGTNLRVIYNQDQASTEKCIISILFDFISSINVSNSLDNKMALECSKFIIQEYYYLTLEEVLLVLKYAKLGKYGQFYNSLDTNKVMSFFSQYVCSQERIDIIEETNKTIKEDNVNILKLIVERNETSKYIVEKKQELVSEILNENDDLIKFKTIVNDLSDKEIDDLIKQCKKNKNDKLLHVFESEKMTRKNILK